MYEDERPIVNLSNECWECLNIIGDVSFANAYTFFWTENLKLVQSGLRKVIPDIKGDWFRSKVNGKTITFSISDQAIADYKPKIQEFSCFGSAVRMLGAYERYVQTVAQVSYLRLPEKMELFEKTHPKILKRRRNKKGGFISYELGRGIDFFNEVFGFDPRPVYKPGLRFFFELRNITVHESGITNQRLIDIMSSPHLSGVKLELGQKVQWNILSLLDLQQLFTQLLPEVDPLISSCLGLNRVAKQAYWYLERQDATKRR